MGLNGRWAMAIVAMLAACAPVSPVGLTPGESPGPSPLSPAPSAPASPAPSGLRTPLPPVITDTPGRTPSPAATSAYNTLFTPGKTWVFDQEVTTGGQVTRGQVRVVVLETTAREATVAVAESPFASPAAAGEVPGRRTRFALDAQNPFEKWGTTAGEAPRPTSMVAEAIAVPAGTFQATKFTYDSFALGYVTHRELWVAEGVGLVRLLSTLRPGGDAGPLTSATVWELEQRP